VRRKKSANDDNEVEVTPAMLAAGVSALEPFLFEGYQIFDSDAPGIARAVWVAMYRRANWHRSHSPFALRHRPNCECP
jgi:hypothetical protein